MLTRIVIFICISASVWVIFNSTSSAPFIDATSVVTIVLIIWLFLAGVKDRWRRKEREMRRIPVITPEGENPCKKKTSVAAKAMVTVLVTKRSKAPLEISQRPKAIPIPIVHKGGIKAVAIATPGSAAES